MVCLLPLRIINAKVSTRFGWIILIAAELVAITHMFHFDYPPHLLAETGRCSRFVQHQIRELGKANIAKDILVPPCRFPRIYLPEF
jgi:hypothetical protein